MTHFHILAASVLLSALPGAPAFADNAGSADQQLSGSSIDRAEANAVAANRVASATPYKVGGKLIGYRLRPGTDRSSFREAGLIPYDTVLSVGGKKIDGRKALEAFLQRLADGEAMKVSLLRAGETVEVMLNAG